MAKIKQLSTHEAQKIAAGEVVERPANIVKELVENSIDAGATRISIYVKDSGKELIRVVDNGCGMDSEDALLCFNRHATSKITHVNELESLTTFGFRGEALASIASVSTITLTTKEEQTLEGTYIRISANTIEEHAPIACQTGTDIGIHNLFFNVPARKKFLKTAQTEWRAIQLLFNAFCFDYPHIHFSLFADDKQVLNCPPVLSLKNRALQLWEPHYNPHLIELNKHTSNECTITGIISDHQHYRYDRSGIYFFVNQRWIKNQSLSSALVKGYVNVIPEGRYPAAVISITVPPHHVDINIHPRKEEVKFLHPKKIEAALQMAVKKTLEHNLSQQIKQDIAFKPIEQKSLSFHQPTQQPISFKPFDFDTFFAQQTQPFTHETETIAHSAEIQTPKQHTIDSVALSPAYKPAEEKNEQIHVAQGLPYNIIGQYNKTYILIEKEEGLFLVDQHAAHERILYELFSTRFNEVATVNLLFPSVITLSPHDINVLLPHIELLHSNGILIEQSGPQQLMVQSLPVTIKDQPIDEIIKAMIGWINDHQSLDTLVFKKTLNEKLHAQMACKAAVKAGDILTREKMEQLLQDLEKTANRFSCPHGRPTGWLLSLHEIEKKFRRKL